MDHIALSIEADVYESNDSLLSIGPLNPEVEGFKWDVTYIPDQRKHSYLSYTGPHSVFWLDGFNLTDWRPGTENGLSLEGIDRIPTGSMHSTLAGEYLVGDVWFHWFKKHIYSDYSVVARAEDNTAGYTKYTPHPDYKASTISIALYQRLDSLDAYPVDVWNVVEQFTGMLDTVSNTRTEITGLPSSWSDLETRVKEVLIDSDILYFNQDASRVIGDGTDVNTFEELGQSVANGRLFYTKYFPIKESSVTIISKSPAGTLRTWTEVETLNTSTATDFHYKVDYDNGIIYGPGFKAPDLTLKEDITATDTDIPVYWSENLEQYPESGIIIIGSEQIYYEYKSGAVFKNCTRGYNATTAAPHTQGDVVEDTQHGASSRDTWYISYTAVPRVEYEITNSLTRTASNNGVLNLHPARSSNKRRIIQLVNKEIDLARIELSTNRASMGGSLYGPLYSGSDTARVTATCYDSYDNPVEGLLVTIEIINGDGLLNGSASSYSAYSNSNGEIYTFFNYPYSDKNFYPVSTTWNDTVNTYMRVPDLPPSVDPSSLWVYQILKHDSIMGSSGTHVYITDGGTGTFPNGAGWVETSVENAEKWRSGYLVIDCADGIRRTFTIKNLETTVDPATLERKTKLWLDKNINKAAWVGTGVDGYMHEAGSEQWTTPQESGVRVILYEWDTGAQHPITGAAGAWAPVHPDSVSGTDLEFTGKLLQIPDPSDDAMNLGGYLVVGPVIVKLRAKAVDPSTGHTIISNELRFYITLPSSLRGVDESGTLPIPYGFRLITDSFNVGTRLAGANFITVNPELNVGQVQLFGGP